MSFERFLVFTWHFLVQMHKLSICLILPSKLNCVRINFDLAKQKLIKIPIKQHRFDNKIFFNK